MKLISLFNGEERSALDVAPTKNDVARVSGETAFGEGWGQKLRGSRAEFEKLGAYETITGELLYQVPTRGGWWLGCQVVEEL